MNIEKRKRMKATEETKEKLSKASKKLWENKEHRLKISKIRKELKQKLGYVNSPETRDKLSKIMKEKWKNGEVSIKQKEGIKTRYKFAGIQTRFKKGHTVPEEWINAVKLSRAKQIFPKYDTIIEIKIQDYLKELGIEFFTHKHMDIPHTYQCDIFIPSLNLVIECDGNYWHSYPTGTEIDHIRTEELIEKGFKVLRLWESDIKNMNLDKLKTVIGGENHFL